MRTTVHLAPVMSMYEPLHTTLDLTDIRARRLDIVLCLWLLRCCLFPQLRPISFSRMALVAG